MGAADSRAGVGEVGADAVGLESRDSNPIEPFRRPLRVLHCLWNGEVGGAERAVHLLVREQLRDPDIAPAMLFAQGRGPYLDKTQRLGCPVITLDLPYGRAVGHLRAATAAMKPFDLHHFHSAEPLLMAASSRCPAVRRIYTHRGGSTRYPAKIRAKYAVTGLLLRRYFHGFSGNTAHAARFAASLYRVDPNRFAVTYNGLDFDLLEPIQPAEEIRTEVGVPSNQFVLGTAANLRAWKRIERLLLAVAELNESNLRLLIVGDGPDRQRLEGLSDELGITRNVVFTGVRLHIGDYLQVMDAFCLPSTAMESFGNAAVEAMGMGIPTIIFSDGGGLLEHLENGITGLVAKDQADLVQVLKRLINEPERARVLGAGGRTSVRSRYTPEAAARRYRQLYDDALPRDRGQTAG